MKWMNTATLAVSLTLLGGLTILPAQADETLLGADPDTTLETVELQSLQTEPVAMMGMAEEVASCHGDNEPCETENKPCPTEKSCDHTWYLETDRTLFSNTPYTVGKDNLMLETGFTYWNYPVPGAPTDPYVNYYSYIEPNFRYGLTNSTEVRVLPTNYASYTGAFNASGMEDTEIGIKQEMPSFWGIDWAIQPGLVIPTGSDNVGFISVTPDLKILWAKPLCNRVTLRGRFLGAWSSYGPFADSTLLSPSAALQVRLSKRWNAFMEWVGGYQNAYADYNLVQGVLTYSTTKNQQLDIHYGLGWTNGTSTEQFVKVGYSFLFHNLFKRNKA